MRTKNVCLTLVFAVASMAAGASAQDVQEPPARAEKPRVEKALTPLKVQIVLSRVQGDKKITSVPYVLWLSANDGFRNNLRMGTQIPIPDGKGSYSYRDVGTNIDAMATSGTDNNYRLSLTLNDSSVYFPDRNDPSVASPTNTGMPAFRSMTANFAILLRDGQTGQYLSATDPVSGQTLRIDATLTVLK
jgi:opacity protein-like surface antigen